tara:strand:- start:79 stop:279 length:201 start_codon:yes stop_codon:yes gene_type:complete
MMGIIGARDIVVKNDDKIGLDSKEVGFVLSLIDESRISGQLLEIALSTRNKLRTALNKLVEKQMGV